MDNKIKFLPKEIIDKMIERQVQQGNKPDVNVFRNYPAANRSEGGFDWYESPEEVEGDDFWHDIIEYKNLDVFYKLYPKNEYSKDEYPKIMMVSDNPITEENIGNKRVVFMKKLDKYLAWANAETFEEAEQISEPTAWFYAEDIKEDDTITLTHEEIAIKLNIDPSKLKIIK